MYLALRKCKNDCKILAIILVPDLCPLKAEIARFSIGFRLKLFFIPNCSHPYSCNCVLAKENLSEEKENPCFTDYLTA